MDSTPGATWIVVRATAGPLCGAHRPGHFPGVTTIVTKLFHLAGPCIAAFGKKDYQQLRVIQRMVTDLFFPVELLPVPTTREPDGLAMSSLWLVASRSASCCWVSPRCLRASRMRFPMRPLYPSVMAVTVSQS